MPIEGTAQPAQEQPKAAAKSKANPKAGKHLIIDCRNEEHSTDAQEEYDEWVLDTGTCIDAADEETDGAYLGVPFTVSTGGGSG